MTRSRVGKIALSALERTMPVNCRRRIAGYASLNVWCVLLNVDDEGIRTLPGVENTEEGHGGKEIPEICGRRGPAERNPTNSDKAASPTCSPVNDDEIAYFMTDDALATRRKRE
ncbi:hypothetical protein PM082_003910 [Marasmius tenuissimus]|nr:hypothetical protein PM082_003910 [Marasmius tenuissimus]